MGFTKTHIDERDVSYADSYWKVAQIHIDINNRTATFLFEGHKNKVARLTRKQVIGKKDYVISGSDFDKAFSDEVKKLRNVRQICYDWAKTIKDIGSGQFEVIIEEPRTTKEIMVSFFEDAVDDLE